MLRRIVKIYSQPMDVADAIRIVQAHSERVPR
jgi:hypothetical protein